MSVFWIATFCIHKDDPKSSRKRPKVFDYGELNRAWAELTSILTELNLILTWQAWAELGKVWFNKLIDTPNEEALFLEARSCFGLELR